MSETSVDRPGRWRGEGSPGVIGHVLAVLASVVHLVCLRVPQQPVHVAVAGLAGAVAGVVYGIGLFDGLGTWLWLQLGVATAVGRAAVIPLAQRRRS